MIPTDVHTLDTFFVPLGVCVKRRSGNDRERSCWLTARIQMSIGTLNVLKLPRDDRISHD